MASLRRAGALLSLILLVYTALIVYMSLSPFARWSAPEGGLFEYLWQPWPRYYTRFDLIANVLAYFPLGFLLYALLTRQFGNWTAAWVGLALGAVLSLSMETTQRLLPDRIASNVDLLTNTLGCALGLAASAWFSRWQPFESALHALRERLFLRGHSVDVGIVLLLLWVLSQLNPSIPLLSAGVVYVWSLDSSPAYFARMAFRTPQAAGVALSFCGFGLFVAVLARSRVAAAGLIALSTAAALLLKYLSAELLLKPNLATLWASREITLGLLFGCLLLPPLFAVPLRWRIYLAGVLIFAGALMSKLAGYYSSLYGIQRLFDWPYGQLLNFTGLTRFLNEFWPLAAVVFLLGHFFAQLAVGSRR